MSIRYITLQNVLITMIDRDTVHTIIPNLHLREGNSFKLIDAHKLVLQVAITVFDLPIIDELKAMFLNGNTTIGSDSIIALIKAKYYANKDVSLNKQLERKIIIDLHEEISKVKTIGRNQLVILLSLCTTKHTNITTHNLSKLWK